MLKKLRTPLILTLFLMVLCGGIYPLSMTLIGQLIFPYQANGSLIEVNGKPVGSKLIGQDFQNENMLKGRPSAVNYNTYTEEQKQERTYTGVASGSHNEGPSSQALIERVESDKAAFLKANPEVKADAIPGDLLTESGSGLDPHISPEAANLQVPRLMQTTGLSEDVLNQMIKEQTTKKWLGVFGEETVNVLQVNLEITNALVNLQK